MEDSEDTSLVAFHHGHGFTFGSILSAFEQGPHLTSGSSCQMHCAAPFFVVWFSIILSVSVGFRRFFWGRLYDLFPYHLFPLI